MDEKVVLVLKQMQRDGWLLAWQFVEQEELELFVPEESTYNYPEMLCGYPVRVTRLARPAEQMEGK